MSTIHLHQTTTSTPEQYVAGLTDFGPGRSKLFSNSADDYLKVHHRGPSDADVTEGSGGIWERLHYDWSDPNHVVLTTTDSNLWGGASGHTYTFTRRLDGLTDIDVVVVRDGKNLKGRLLGFVLGTIGKGVLEKAFENSVKAIEARNGAAREARSSMSRVAVSANLLSGSASPPGTSLNLRWRPLIHPRNAVTYPAATLHSDCGRGLVPKDAASMGPRGQAFARFQQQ